MLISSRATLLIGIAVNGATLSGCAQAGTHALALLLGAWLVIPLAHEARRAGPPITALDGGRWTVKGTS
jgi:hypothetical protein